MLTQPYYRTTKMKPKYDVNEIASFINDDPDSIIDPSDGRSTQVSQGHTQQQPPASLPPSILDGISNSSRVQSASKAQFFND